MRPVAATFPVSQQFGSYATAGVVGNPNGTEVQQLVAAYGNYQPYGHAGQDIACPIGTPVHAIADGTVLWADWGTNLPGDDSWSASGYFRRWALYKTFPGIVTVVQHDGWISVYAHLSDAPLNAGDRVTEGQVIARSGNTRSPGVSLAAHLHVEALVDLNYTTGGGLIYGRTDPTPFYGAAAIAPQSTTITPEDDMPTLDEIFDHPIPRAGGQPGSTTLRAFLAYWDANNDTTRKIVNAVPDKVWSQTVLRGGQRVSVKQELADAKTAAQMVLVKAAPAVDVKSLAAEIAAHLTLNQAHQFIVALGQALPKE